MMGYFATSTGTYVAGAAILTIDAVRVTSTVVHDIVGRPDPIAVLGGTSARKGTIVVRCSTATQVEDLVVQLLGKRFVLGCPELPAFHGMPGVVISYSSSQWEYVDGAWWWDLSLEFAETA